MVKTLIHISDIEDYYELKKSVNTIFHFEKIRKILRYIILPLCIISIFYIVYLLLIEYDLLKYIFDV